MTDAVFPGMTPELQAYLDYVEASDTQEPGVREERERLEALVPRELQRAFDRYTIDQKFLPEHKASHRLPREWTSPSGKYHLIVDSYRTREGCWDYAQGQVIQVPVDATVEAPKTIAIVNRNYSAFPHLFIEGHPNGHDYLVCGEDYQGQTVIELDTGKRIDHLPPEAAQGFAFCWASMVFHPGPALLLVSGCHWACPYEFRFYDFADPMGGWPEIESSEGMYCDRLAPTIDDEGFITCYQSEPEEEDDADDDDQEPAHVAQEPLIAATQIFRREGMKFLLVGGRVSKKEVERRAARVEEGKKYDQWLADFRATDPLYLEMQEQLKAPTPSGRRAFTPEDHESIGLAYDGWHPTLRFEDATTKSFEKRMCRRIATEGVPKIGLEWAHLTGPIKLIVTHRQHVPPTGKSLKETVRADQCHGGVSWYEHTTEGMKQAFEAARQALGAVIAREDIPRRVSDILGRPVRWASHYVAHARTLEVFNADAGEQLGLVRSLRTERPELEQAAGGPLVLVFHTWDETRRLYPEMSTDVKEEEASDGG